MFKPPPELPQGNAGILQGVSENFSFHASPEAFIASRALDFQKTHPEDVVARKPVRAKILNRNVAVISSYSQIKRILEDQSTDGDRPVFVAGAAYKELMNSFFPPPNLLLADGQSHKAPRQTWEGRVQDLPNKLSSAAKATAQAHLMGITEGSAFDLYEAMKTLSWNLLLGAFLDLHSEDSTFGDFQRLHEDLLRGQFSLFPVQVNLGFWHSPRKVGVDARKRLQVLIADRLQSSERCCPFAMEDENARKDVADHTLLFTSSLAAKGLASLLTAFFLHLYVFRDDENHCLADILEEVKEPAARRTRLQRILTETERLSPPIVGVMRRCAEEFVLPSSGDQADVLIPAGWDAWLYFVGAGRDAQQFGETCNSFQPERYSEPQTASPLAFGAGLKSCLGKDVARNFVLDTAEVWLEKGRSVACEALPKGVQGWLGWNSEVGPEVWAADMKQLPTQRPARPVMVTLSPVV